MRINVAYNAGDAFLTVAGNVNDHVKGSKSTDCGKFASILDGYAWSPDGRRDTLVVYKTEYDAKRRGCTGSKIINHNQNKTDTIHKV